MGPQFGCDILSLLKQIYLFELKTILNINSLMFFFFCHFFFLDTDYCKSESSH